MISLPRTFAYEVKNYLQSFLVSVKRYPYFVAPVATMCLASFMLMSTWMAWQIAAVLLLAWTPCIFCIYARISKRDDRLGLFFALMVVQGGHFMEHIVQMIQIHIMQWPFAQSHGLFGVLFDTEWFHFFFDAIFIPYCSLMLLVTINRRATAWLWLLLPLALLHAAEHFAIMQTYFVSHHFGSPGIFANGGLIGSPLSRPDLHFMYNLFEEVFIILGFYSQLKGR